MPGSELIRGDLRGLGGPMLMTPSYLKPHGLVVPGNIDLSSRPMVKNPDGSISTVRSMSFEEDGHEILVPTVSDDGRVVSDEEAVANYKKTGKHLGIFDSPENATSYAQRLHSDYAEGNIPESPRIPSRSQLKRWAPAMPAPSLPAALRNRQ